MESPIATARVAVLNEAAGLISRDRNLSYDEPESNFRRIAAYWNLYLTDHLLRPIQPHQVAMILGLVKVAREQHAPKRDNLVDLAGYAACYQEVIEAQPDRTAADPAAALRALELALAAAETEAKHLLQAAAGEPALQQRAELLTARIAATRETLREAAEAAQ